MGVVAVIVLALGSAQLFGGKQVYFYLQAQLLNHAC